MSAVRSLPFAVMTFALVLMFEAGKVNSAALSMKSTQNSAEMSGLALRWTGACRCQSKTFAQGVNGAYASVQVRVIWRGDIFRLSKTDRKLLIRAYKLHIIQRFSKNGPSKGTTIYAEAFDNVDFCGVRLVSGNLYMLNLANPAKRSEASQWPKGIFVLDACQLHFGWRAMKQWQKDFLFALL